MDWNNLGNQLSLASDVDSESQQHMSDVNGAVYHSEVFCPASWAISMRPSGK